MVNSNVCAPLPDTLPRESGVFRAKGSEWWVGWGSSIDRSTDV
jgi:hypothetical protein